MSSMVVDKLFDAIAAQFIGVSAAAALETAFGGRFFPEEVTGDDADKTFPYVVYEQIPTAPLTDAYGDATSADVTVVFKVIGRGHNAVAGHMRTLVGALDHTTLTLSGGTNIGMYRTGEPVRTKLADDGAGTDVWQWAVAYAYQIQ